MAKDKFGEAVFELETNSKKFEEGLRKAESKAKTASQKISDDLKSIPKALDGVAGSSANASQALSLVSTASSTFGGSISAALTPLSSALLVIDATTASNVTLAGSFTALTATIVATSAANITLAGTFAILETAIFPILIPLAALGLAVFEVVKAYKALTAGSRLLAKSDKEIAEREQELRKRLDARLVARQRAEKAAISALEKRIKLAKGAKESDFLTGTQKALQLELERIEQAKKLEQERAEQKKRDQEKEKQRLKELADAEKRRADEAARAAKQAAKEAEARRRARETGQARNLNVQEAKRTLEFLVEESKKTQLANQRLLIAAQGIISSNPALADEVGKALARQGISFTQQSSTPAVKAGKVGGGVSAASFRGRISGASVISASPEIRANKVREKQLTVLESIKNELRLANKTQRAGARA